MKIKRKQLSLAVVNALNAGVVASLAAPLVYAQQTPVPSERIEVTGSRIPSPALTSESPVTVLNAEDIKITGSTSTSDILNQLPQVAVGQGNKLSNGATGTSTVDLRGLGPSRSLVLIDGKRMQNGDVNTWATDINNIPAPLIKRVEVLTGGASAVYGSDAIAGVVNFIMNDSFEGIQFDYNWNGYNHNQNSWVAGLVAGKAATNPAQYAVPGNIGIDGQTNDFSVTLGGNFAGGKGNATVYFEHRDVNAVTQATRDFSACSLSGLAAGGYTCGGSSTSFPGRFSGDQLAHSFTIANAEGGVRPYSTANDAFNFAPYNYFQRPDNRYLANFFAHYDALPNVRFYTELDFMDDKTNAVIAPSGAFLQPFTLTNANPLLSQQFKNAAGISAANPTNAVYIGRRNIEGGGRDDDIEHESYRIVGGAKGSLFDNKWDYNAWWQFGKMTQTRIYKNDFSVVRLGRAFNVVTNPANGQPVCASVLDGTDPNCVPYNIFATGGVTQAALNYLQTPGLQIGDTKQAVYGLNLTSDLGTSYGWTLPWARNGAGVALGFEHRMESLHQQTDIEFDTFDLAGQGGPTHPLNGSYNVNEFYGEVRVPIIERQSWAYNLEVNGAYRHSDYSTDKKTNTYGFGAKWAPIKEAELRGTYQRAVRAANIVELFAAQGFNLFTGTDPCAPGPAQATLQQCLRTGLLASQYGSPALLSPAGQYNYVQGGNPDLNPETAKTYTIGGVFQYAGVSATIDWWHIDVADKIGLVPPSGALTQCVTNGLLCDLIHRGPNGNLWIPGQGFVLGTNQNLGRYTTDGIDINVNYNLPIDSYGGLNFNLIGTWVDKFEVEPVKGLGSYDCAGFFGPTCAGIFPKWRHKFQTTWNTPWNVNAALTWRYTASVDVDFSSSNPLLNGPYAPSDNHLASQSYFDLALSWNVDKNFTIRGGVNNMFDRDPPLVSSTAGAFPAIAGPAIGNGNTYPQAYDTLGRNFFVNITAKF